VIDATHTPQLFEALAESGKRPEAARRVEREVQCAIDQGIVSHWQNDRNDLMTKADGLALDCTLHTQMVEFKAELRREMGELKSELRQEMGELKSELRQEMGQLESCLMRHISDHGWKMMGFQVATMGLLLTAFKYLH
jgi:ElaB/YqjD/DUF883 family membrane-anchored ribosome-binding protein